MKNKKLARAIATALGSAALSVASITPATSGTTMYNKYISGGSEATGAVCGGGAAGGACAGATDGWAAYNWLGTGAGGTEGAAAFGYSGTPVMHWGVEFSGDTDAAEISSQDAFDRYGVYADIDTAKGAWLDPAANFGWKHDLDVGLFRTDTDSSITLSMSGNNFGGDFGFTILEGMNSNAGFYNHHGSWNQNHDGTNTPLSAAGVPDYGDVIVNTSIADDVPGQSEYGINTITFDAEAGQLYTILVGGYKNGTWFDTNDGYTLQVEASAVPLPAAVWLFGSALAGLGVVRRKPKQA